MQDKFFGTDGIRGRANHGHMTPDVIVRIAQAAGVHFLRGNHRHQVVIGKDTRLSGYMVEPSLTAGFVSIGMDVVLVGPLSTPAISMLTRSLRADLGVVISASHNPYEDNGIKFFGPDGYKLPDEVEHKIETSICNFDSANLKTADALGRAKRLDDAAGRYVEYVKNTFPKGMRLDGLKIVIDCANGAAYKIAPTVLWELGANIIELGTKPDGCNINKGCGATATEAMRAAVINNNADLGISLDGDGDRVMIADNKGQLVDGDHLIALIAGAWAKNGMLTTNKVVTTVMSNLGLEKYLESLGIDLIRSQVGDRYVIEEMRKHGTNLGGEQSGHIIMSDYILTGDGLISALQAISVILQSGLPASEVARPFKPFPQIMRNLRLTTKKDILSLDHVRKNIDKVVQDLGANGRLLIRKSGTEPLIRVMGESKDLKMITQVVDDVVEMLKKEG